MYDFEASLGYRVRLCLKKPKTNKQKSAFVYLEFKLKTISLFHVFC